MKALAEIVKVLIIGNNPLELAQVVKSMEPVSEKILTETAFDYKGVFHRLSRFSPNFIIVDDNLGRAELSLTVKALQRSKKTRNIPIAVLKSSNYHEVFGGVALNYILKETLSEASLMTAFRNTRISERAQLYFKNLYAKRKRSRRRLFGLA